MRRLGNLYQRPVGTSSAPLVDANPKRRALLLIPASNQTVFVTDQGTATLTNGIPVNQGTQGILLTYENFGELITGGLQAISAVATNLGIAEGYDAD
jgi:hypothetical protein